MNYPQAIADLITAQDKFDSKAYADCFSISGKLIDEGKECIGRQEISAQVARSNEAYTTVMKPISYEGSAENGILTTEVSGSFPSSPLIFIYYFEYDGDLIQSLTITL